MKTYNLMKLVDATSSFDFKYTLDGETVTVWDGNEFFIIARQFYNFMLFDAYTVDDSTPTPEAAAKAEFIYNLGTWETLHGEDYARAIKALYSEYNPIENYNRIEEGSEETARHKGSKVTRTVDEDGTETLEKHHGTKVSTSEETIGTPRVKTKNTTYKVPFDSSTEVETDALVSEPVQGTDKTEKDPTKNYTTQEDVSASVFDKDVRNFTDRETTETTTNEDIDANTYDKDVLSFNDRVTRGNIGTLTTQSMIASETALRVQGFRESLIRKFITEFCYYVKGVE